MTDADNNYYILEKEANAARADLRIEAAIQLSIAISLKRIADAQEKMLRLEARDDRRAGKVARKLDRIG